MKSLATLSFPLLATAAAVPRLVARQEHDSFFGSLLGGSGIPNVLDALSTTPLEPQFDPKAKRERQVWGPFKMQSSNATHAAAGGLKLDANSDVFNAMLNGICKECMVLQATAQVAFENGTRQDASAGVYTHHVIITDVGRPLVTLPVLAKCANGTQPGFTGFGGVGTVPTGAGGAGGHGDGHGHGHKKKRQSLLGEGFSLPEGIDLPPISVFVGTGEDASPQVFASKDSKVKSGFYIGKDDMIMAMIEAINYHPYEKDIYLSIDIEYLPGEREPGWLDVGMGAINIDGCGGSIGFHPSADGPVSMESNEWIAGQSGYLLNFTPHLHDGSVDIEVFLNGKLVCHSDAIYGGADGSSLTIGDQSWQTISGYTECSDTVRVEKGDILTMTSLIDLTKHPLRPDSQDHDMGHEAMALANFMFAADPA